MTAAFRFAGLPLALSLVAAGLSAGTLVATPATAQMFSTSYQFLQAVRERDGTKVTELLGEPGTTIINTRDTSTGRTALHIVVERRDLTWLAFLLQRGADPAISDRQGLTPLRQATEIGFVEGARALIERGANVNQANTRGETPLHIAVQRRDIAMVRMLVAAGANADVQDSVAGMSPRDYAAQDTRSATVLAALNAPRPAAPAAAAPVAGPR